MSASVLRAAPSHQEKHERGKEEEKGAPQNTIGRNTRVTKAVDDQRQEGKARKGTARKTIDDSRYLKSVAAYHDLQHAVGRLDDLISDTLLSKPRPLRSGLCTFVHHEFLLHEFVPLGVLLGMRALARLAALPACVRHCVRSSTRPLGRSFVSST